MKAGRGRGGRGIGRASKKNLITTYTSGIQQEKKQKVETSATDDTWENMDENQQNE